MLTTIARLFGKSPFAPLQTHMNRVAGCMEKLGRLFDVLAKTEIGKIDRLAQDVALLEHEADIIKNDIRNHLPKSLFLPIDKSHFLEILAIQDSIADQAEAISLLAGLLPSELLGGFEISLQQFFQKNAEVFWVSKSIISEIGELLEALFGGIEAEKVKGMVELVAAKENEAQQMKKLLLKELFASKEPCSHQGFYLRLKLIEEVSALSHISERLANRIRMILELK